MKIVLASVLVIILASISGICSARHKCNQAAVYRRCNHVAAQVHVRGPLPSRHHNGIYCKGVKALITCLSDDPCDGEFIDQYRFLVLQAAIMSRKMVCKRLPYHGLKKYTAGVARKLGLPDLEPISARGDRCAKETFSKCALVYSTTLKKKLNICDDFRATIECFRSKKGDCKRQSPILRKYRKILFNLGTPLIKSAKKHAADMCF